MTTVPRDQNFLHDVMIGLSSTPKYLPGKYLWDEIGSQLFDRICDNPDYYPMQREVALLPDVVCDLAALVGPAVTIVEFGSGASRKIRMLLDGLERPARYVAIDISRDYLEASVRALARDYPEIEMIPVCADYSRPFHLPIELEGPVLGFFPGTSIGNMTPDEARNFLARAHDVLGPNRLLVGADPTQDEERLSQVYGDCDGLMPALHLNLLTRIKRELGAQIDCDAFRHGVHMLPDPFRVEAHLIALRPNAWHLDENTIEFHAGERIRTDTSYKYPPEVFQRLAAQSGWKSERLWVCADESFSLHLLDG